MRSTCKRRPEGEHISTQPIIAEGTRALPLPRIAEQNIATIAIIPPIRKLKFIARTNAVGFAAVGSEVAGDCVGAIYAEDGAVGVGRDACKEEKSRATKADATARRRAAF